MKQFSTKTKWIALIVTVFLTGLVFGFVGGQFWQHYQFAKRFRERPKTDKFLEDLTRELSLTPEQAKKVSAILESRKEEFEKVIPDFREKIREIREKTDKEIEAILTPEQKIKFSRFREKQFKHERRKGPEDMPGGPGMPPGPPPPPPEKEK
jgi:uncharacterized protein YneF (UPF0154 family)